MKIVVLSILINSMIWWGIAISHVERINIKSLEQKPTRIFKIKKEIKVPLQKKETKKKPPKKKKEVEQKVNPTPPKAIPKKIVESPPEEVSPETVVEEVQTEIIDSTELSSDVVPIRSINPTYPPVARKLGLEAKVYLEVIISPKGKVEHVTVAYCSLSDQGFEESAIDAVKALRFEPVIHDGKPVRVKIVYPIDFVLVE